MAFRVGKGNNAGVFELAMATLRVDRDPVYPVRRALPPNKTQHKRALEPDEIGRLLRDMAGHGGRHETLAAFRLLSLRCMSRAEITRIRVPSPRSVKVMCSARKPAIAHQNGPRNT